MKSAPAGAAAQDRATAERAAPAQDPTAAAADTFRGGATPEPPAAAAPRLAPAPATEATSPRAAERLRAESAASGYVGSESTPPLQARLDDSPARIVELMPFAGGESERWRVVAAAEDARAARAWVDALVAELRLRGRTASVELVLDGRTAGLVQIERAAAGGR